MRDKGQTPTAVKQKLLTRYVPLTEPVAVCKIANGDPNTMSDESIKRAAHEYLAERLSEEGLTAEQTLNRQAAITLAAAVWLRFAETVVAMCNEWNAVTKEASLTCTETVLGDLRIRCAGRSHQLVFHYGSSRRLVRVENSAREEHEPKVVLSIEGYATESGRGARLMRNLEAVNVEMLIRGQLRVLAGLSRKAESEVWARLTSLPTAVLRPRGNFPRGIFRNFPRLTPFPNTVTLWPHRS
jgi:hypothetical protein